MCQIQFSVISIFIHTHFKSCTNSNKDEDTYREIRGKWWEMFCSTETCEEDKDGKKEEYNFEVLLDNKLPLFEV